MFSVSNEPGAPRKPCSSCQRMHMSVSSQESGWGHPGSLGHSSEGLILTDQRGKSVPGPAAQRLGVMAQSGPVFCLLLSAVLVPSPGWCSGPGLSASFLSPQHGQCLPPEISLAAAANHKGPGTLPPSSMGRSLLRELILGWFLVYNFPNWEGGIISSFLLFDSLCWAGCSSAFGIFFLLECLQDIPKPTGIRATSCPSLSCVFTNTSCLHQRILVRLECEILQGKGFFSSIYHRTGLRVYIQ